MSNFDVDFLFLLSIPVVLIMVLVSLFIFVTPYSERWEQELGPELYEEQVRKYGSRFDANAILDFEKALEEYPGKACDIDLDEDHIVGGALVGYFLAGPVGGVVGAVVGSDTGDEGMVLRHKLSKCKKYINSNISRR